MLKVEGSVSTESHLTLYELPLLKVELPAGEVNWMAEARGRAAAASEKRERTRILIVVVAVSAAVVFTAKRMDCCERATFGV